MDGSRFVLALLGVAGVAAGFMFYGANRNNAKLEEYEALQADEAVEAAAPGAQEEPARITDEEVADGFEPLIGEWEGQFNKHGWNHYGPGWFTLDHDTGVLASHGGMGLMWHTDPFGDFVLRLEFMTSVPESNSGVFIRVPEMPTSDDYIYHSFEIQIHDTAVEAIHRTGAVYDAEPPSVEAIQHTGGVFDAEAPAEHRGHPPGEWHDMEISFIGDVIKVSLNGELVVDWQAEPRGKIEDFADRGYIGLQNHDWDTSVYFRNLRVKKLD